MDGLKNYECAPAENRGAYLSEEAGKVMVRHIVLMLAVVLAAVSPAATVVDFDADDISAAITKSSDFLFSETSVTLDDVSSAGYSGQPVYGGFREEGVSLWSANNRSNAGLKVRWNGGAGVAGETASGLYLFQQEDFLNGLDSGSVAMDADSDTVSGEAGYISPGDGTENPAVASSTIRFVLKDISGTYISEAMSLVSSTPFSFEATALSYFSFDPTVNTSVAAGTIGSASTPAFTGISWVGFRIDAVRGSKISQGVNIGVELFSVQAASAPSAMIIDGGLRHQKIEGFGASVAFYINRLVDNVHSNELADLLFRDLNLDIFRMRNLYLADDTDLQGKVDDTLNTLRLGEAALGRPMKILMSGWTPPSSLKSNTNKVAGTLASDAGGYRYDDFAQWWADSLDYYSALGVTPDYISIQNEANWEATHASCKFEPVETTEFAGYNIAFEKTWQTLAGEMGTADMPKMLAAELVAFGTLDEYLDNLLYPAHAYGYAHHLYSQDVGCSPELLNTEMQATGEAYGYKPLFQTEYYNGESPTEWLRKYNLAKLMHNSLTLEQVSAYLYWCLFWPIGDGQALITVPDNSSYEINPEYYAFKHYSAFIQSDWRRLDTVSTEAGVDLSAYISPDKSQVTVVILNANAGAADLDLYWEELEISGGDVYRTTSSLNCTNIGSFNPASALSVPGESITTLALTAVTNAVPENPNILMICVDDLRPETRCYGASQMITPNIDQLAADGYQFNRAYVQQAVCSPSRASMMTGLRPDTTQVFDLVTDFRDTIPWVETLPQYLRGYGYYSAGIGKIYHGGLNDDLTWDEPWSAGSGTYGSVGAGNPPTERADVEDNELRDGAVTDDAILKLADLKTKQPFFYGVGYVRPHLPFVAPTAYWNLYADSDLVLPHTDDPAVDSSSYAYTTWGELRDYDDIPATGPVSDDQEKELIHGYYASISYMDAQLGRLMTALEAEGLADNTIVVLWGDHGWHLGDHGQWCKHTNYERATRIPMIVKVPWMPGASQIDALTEVVDLYPTLLDLCGIPEPSTLEGDSLVPLLEAPESAGDADAISQYPRDGNMGYSMRTDRYRYTEWRVENSTILVDRELYDHFLDPLEDTNVVDHAAYAADVALLEAQLQSRLDALSPSSASDADNLVVNGGFDDGTNSWTQTESNDADANFTVAVVEDPQLNMEITNGGNVWDLAIEQIVPAQSNKLYTIRFKASAAAIRTIKLLWRNKDNIGDAYLSLNVPLTTETRLYELTGIQLENIVGTDPDAELRIQFGGDASDVWIDSIQVCAQTSLSAALADAGLSGEDALLNADSDADDVSNLIEYACNMNMAADDRHVLVSGTGTSGLPTHQMAPTNSFQTLEIEYLRRRGAADLEYIPEFAGDLFSNGWKSGLTETVESIDSDWERVTVRDPETSETNSARFGRVRVLFNP